MSKINLNLDYAFNFFSKDTLLSYKDLAKEALNKLLNGSGKGNDFIGWVKYPVEIKESLIEDILKTKEKISRESKCLVVIGIGGSYLGAKACYELFKPYYKKEDFEVIFIGNDISPDHLYETIEYLKDVDFSINVISKSGKTLEPALAFRLVKEVLISKYKDSYKDRIYVVTSSENSIINDEAKLNGYKRFFIPDNIGGRYSVFTPCGLIPISLMGIDIKEILSGAKDAYLELTKLPFENNPALLYASARNILYKQGYSVEIQASFEPKLRYYGEWWKQLFGESEGKEKKGILPYTVTYSTDLHSLGQYVQDGMRNIFETFIDFDKDQYIVNIPYDEANLDNLNYLSGKDVNFVRKQALSGVQAAHNDGLVPIINLTMDKITPYNFGYLSYFFMLTCGISGYILDVNPFNQEGVEAYKKNMQALLRK